MGNRPLLFVKSPPAYFKEIEEDIESLEDVSESKPVLEEDVELRKRKEKLLFLSNPFQQKAYQPLVFVINDGQEISGEVYKVNVETQEVMIRTANNVVHPIAIAKIKDLLWRGRSFFK
ncbi:hypothetical protein [Rummeliibacillus suwonensis]|uniref:hypothetical protein n=1 Tax=Rummeliibacillus suwonensis TaxID=1306154 RepID=UPI00289BD5AE|nr:hypothetical protein [Rummeliibacillus suwonensis]